MSCPIHKGITVTAAGKITSTKTYSPPVQRKVFGQPVTWFNKIELNDEAGKHLTLYDFELRDQPETRSQINGKAAKGKTIIGVSYYEFGDKKNKGCIRTCEIV